ncbi:MAG: FtsX-like permease family protein [Treponema sp.]|nr:FtsX-like permease family protein [Treponema sp.]
MFSLILALKNVISRKSSFVIVLFIAFAIAMMVVSNAVFDGTGNGIQNTFVNSFTGDIVVRPKAEFPLSLLGDETPGTGSYSEIPFLIPYTQVHQVVHDTPGIRASTAQVTGVAVMNINEDKFASIFFGVDSALYTDIMPGIHILDGRPYDPDEKGIMLSTAMLDYIEEDCGTRPAIGDSIQIVSTNGRSFNMRSAQLTGIYEYPTDNEVLSRIVLASPEVVREVCGMVHASTSLADDIAHENQNLLNEDFDIDDLFGDTFTEAEESFLATADEKTDEVVVAEDTEISEDTIWNYVVCSVQPGVPVAKVIKELNAEFKKQGWDVEAVGWRSAAGLSAMYLYWMRLIFNIGIIVILGTGFIVVHNTLVVSALDRTNETGTLRAIGADRSFVAVQFLLETAILTVFAGIIGCILGMIGTNALSSVQIVFHNNYLIQLFGGTTLSISVTAANIIQGFVVSVLLALIGWIYPAHIATQVSPVEAMVGLH